MPISLYDLHSDRKTVTLDIAGGQLTVTYKPNALTPARELALIRQARDDVTREDDDDPEARELEAAEFNINKQITTFCEVVEAWDFEGPLAVDKEGLRLDLPRDQQGLLESQAFAESQGGKIVVPAGETVPLRQEFLRILPSHFLMEVQRLINEDMRPNRKRPRS